MELQAAEADAFLSADLIGDGSEVESSDLERKLISEETLDVASPELWPPAQEIAPEAIPEKAMHTPPALKKKLIDMVTENTESWLGELSLMSRNQLMRHVKELENTTYQLAQDQSHEIMRGKFLNILDSSLLFK